MIRVSNTSPAAASLPPELFALTLEHALGEQKIADCANLKLVNRATLAAVERALPTQTAAQLCRAALFCGLPAEQDSTYMRTRLRNALAAGQTLDITLVPNVPVRAGHGPKVYFSLAERLEARGQLYDHAQAHADVMLFELSELLGRRVFDGHKSIDRNAPLLSLGGRSIAAHAKAVQENLSCDVPEKYSFDLFADALGTAISVSKRGFFPLSLDPDERRLYQAWADTLLALCSPRYRQQAARDAEHEEVGRVEYAQLIGSRWRALLPELLPQLPLLRKISLTGIFPFGVNLDFYSYFHPVTTCDNAYPYHLHRDTTRFAHQLLNSNVSCHARLELCGSTDLYPFCDIIKRMHEAFGERFTLQNSADKLDKIAFPQAAHRPYTDKRKKENQRRLLKRG